MLPKVSHVSAACHDKPSDRGQVQGVTRESWPAALVVLTDFRGKCIGDASRLAPGWYDMQFAWRLQHQASAMTVPVFAQKSRLAPEDMYPVCWVPTGNSKNKPPAVVN